MREVETGRKQRLLALEEQIRRAAEEIKRHGLDIGRWLCEIRDHELWRGPSGYPSWSEYLKAMAFELVGKSFAQAARLIRAAEVSRKLPESLSCIDATELTPTHLAELGRLAPNVSRGDHRGVEKDYSRVRTRDLERVLAAAAAIAGSRAPSVQHVRKAVDDDLGLPERRRAEREELARMREESQRLQEETQRKRAEWEESRSRPEHRLHELEWQARKDTEELRAAIGRMEDGAWAKWKEDKAPLVKDVADSWLAYFELLGDKGTDAAALRAEVERLSHDIRRLRSNASRPWPGDVVEIVLGHLRPTPRDVSTWYRALCKKYHPDHGGAEAEMRVVNCAAELLRAVVEKS